MNLLESYGGQDAIESKPHGLQSYAPEDDASKMVSDVVAKDEDGIDKVHIMNQLAGDEQRDEEEFNRSSGRNLPGNGDSTVELQCLKMQLKKMEAALLGAARQAQSIKC